MTILATMKGRQAMPTKLARPTAAQRTIAAREARTRKILRIVALIGSVPVALVSAKVSYEHAYALTLAHGQSTTTAMITPIGIDGGMLVASVSYLATRSKVSLASLAFGMFLSLAANVLSVTDHRDVIGYVLAGSYSAVLILTAENILRLVAPRRPKARQRQRAPRKAPQKTTATVKAPRTTRVPATPSIAATA